MSKTFNRPTRWLPTDVFSTTGGKHFSRNLRPLDADGNEISMWAEDAPKEDDSDEETSSEEEDSDEESDDDAGPSNSTTAAQELSREERKKEKKARKEAAIARAKAGNVQVGDLPPSDSEEEEDDDMPANPNHSKAARKQLIAPSPDVDEATAGVSKLAVKNQQPQSRRERESLEAAQAKERYMKLHEAGKTDEAKADLERLRKIREERDAAAARRKVRTLKFIHPDEFIMPRYPFRAQADRYFVFSRPKKRRERNRRPLNVPRSRRRKPRSARQPLASLPRRASLRNRSWRTRTLQLNYQRRFLSKASRCLPFLISQRTTHILLAGLTVLSQRLRVDVVNHIPRSRYHFFIA